MEVPSDTYNNFRAIVSYHTANTFYNNLYTDVIDSDDMNIYNLEDKYKARAKKYIDIAISNRDIILTNLLALHVRHIQVHYTLESYVSLFTKYISSDIVKVKDESRFCAQFLVKLYEKMLIHIITTGVNKITTTRPDGYMLELEKVANNLFIEAKNEINISSVSNDSRMEYIRSLEKRLEDIRKQYVGLSQKYEELLTKYNAIKDTPRPETKFDFENYKPKNTEPIPQFYTTSHQSEDEEYRAFVAEENKKKNMIIPGFKSEPKPEFKSESEPEEIIDFFSPDI